jgi:thiol:disulfide interchange protein
MFCTLRLEDLYFTLSTLVDIFTKRYQSEHRRDFMFSQNSIMIATLSSIANQKLHTSRFLLMLLTAFAVFGASIVAKAQRPEPAKWILKPTAISMKAGDTTKLTLSVKIDEGWHVYGLKDYINAEGIGPSKTEFELDDKSFSVLSKGVTSSKPIVAYDSAFEVKVEKFKHHAEFTVPITSKSTLKAGVYKLKLKAYYQVCTNQNCLPGEAILPITIDVTPADKSQGVLGTTDTSNTATAKVETEEPSTPQSGTTKTVEVSSTPSNQNSESAGTEAPSSMIDFLLIAIGLGFSAWFMPCVYPMIPITVSFFTKRAEKEHTSSIVDSLTYSFGIMSTYIIFGAVLAIFWGASVGSDIATNPTLNLFLAALFLVIAGNLFGMYEIALPSRFVNNLNQKSNEKKGYSASFIMGMVFSLTSFTCTVPFVSLVGSLVEGGEWFRPIIGMAVFSAVFAFPFFLLALFPSVMTKLPRSGAWMNNIKVVFGFVEVAFAVSYFARVDSLLGWSFISREVVLAIWAGCSILIMLYILGTYRMELDGPVQHIGGLRALLAIAFATTTFYLFAGIQGGSIGPLEPFVYAESSRQVAQVSTPSSSEISTVAHKDGQWYDDLDKALIIAKKQNKPVFVDFTGVTCSNCRWMEKNMFPKPKVSELMNSMILVRAYTDRRYNPMDKKYREMQSSRFNSTLLPLYVLLTPDNKLIGSISYTDKEQEFISFLQKAQSSSSQAKL